LKELPPTYTSSGRIFPRGRGTHVRNLELRGDPAPTRVYRCSVAWPGGKAKAPCRRGSEVWTELLISSFVEGRERAEGRVKVARKMECMTGGPEEPRPEDAHGADKETW
jgi:hypothetical protein